MRRDKFKHGVLDEIECYNNLFNVEKVRWRREPKIKTSKLRQKDKYSNNKEMIFHSMYS